MSVLKKENGKLKVAVIEGWHPFEVPQWQELFASFDDMDCYLQSIENWAFDCAGCRKDYDVVLFYNMNMEVESSSFKEQLQNAIEELGDTNHGIIMLHHSILAYPKNQVWSDIVGINERTFNYYPDQDFTINSVNPDHPITKNIASWEIHDETYTMANAESNCEVLLTADYEKSMRTIAWTKMHKNSRVFSFQCGHDHIAWENPTFKQILSNGIKWAARKL